MGLYDRPYYQEEERRRFGAGGGPKSIVMTIIAINTFIFIVDAILIGDRHWLSKAMMITPETIVSPWLWWKSITYAFAHSPRNFWHIFGNMLTLFFFGQRIESDLGRYEFLRLYLILAIFSGFVWAGLAYLNVIPGRGCYGASGAVSGILMLFILRHPRDTILASLLIPVPAWLYGAFWVLYDLFGWADPQSNIAHSAHFSGMAFAVAYFYGKWNFGFLPSFNLNIGGWLQSATRRRPKLRVHNPESTYAQLNDQADEILEKMHRKGKESLTAKEQKILDEYSRRMQQKHR